MIKRNGEVTVNIALVRHGQPVAGLVGAPALGLQYLAAQGEGTVRCDASGETQLAIAAQKTGKPLRVLGSRSHAAVILPKRSSVYG